MIKSVLFISIERLIEFDDQTTLSLIIPLLAYIVYIIQFSPTKYPLNHGIFDWKRFLLPVVCGQASTWHDTRYISCYEPTCDFSVENGALRKSGAKRKGPVFLVFNIFDPYSLFLLPSPQHAIRYVSVCIYIYEYVLYIYIIYYILYLFTLSLCLQLFDLFIFILTETQNASNHFKIFLRMK